MRPILSTIRACYAERAADSTCDCSWKLETPHKWRCPHFVQYTTCCCCCRALGAKWDCGCGAAHAMQRRLHLFVVLAWYAHKCQDLTHSIIQHVKSKSRKAKDMHMTSSLHTNFVDTLACTLPLSHKLRENFPRHLAVVPVLVAAIHGICIHYDGNPFVFVPQRDEGYARHICQYQAVLCAINV